MKCLIKGTEFCQQDFVNSTALFRHFMDSHTDHAVSSYLAVMLFKADAKIEENKNLLPKRGGTNSYDCQDMCWESEINVLESLLGIEK